jgi:hypothetical protein
MNYPVVSYSINSYLWISSSSPILFTILINFYLLSFLSAFDKFLYLLSINRKSFSCSSSSVFNTYYLLVLFSSFCIYFEWCFTLSLYLSSTYRFFYTDSDFSKKKISSKWFVYNAYFFVPWATIISLEDFVRPIDSMISWY